MLRVTQTIKFLRKYRHSKQLKFCHLKCNIKYAQTDSNAIKLESSQNNCYMTKNPKVLHLVWKTKTVLLNPFSSFCWQTKHHVSVGARPKLINVDKVFAKLSQAKHYC